MVLGVHCEKEYLYVYNDNKEACTSVFVLYRLRGLFTLFETRPINLELGNVSKICIKIYIVIGN